MGKYLIGSVGVSLLAFACSGGGGSVNSGPATPASVASLCHTDCVHRVMCQDPMNTRTVEECDASCQMELGAGWVRQDVAEDILACSAALACDVSDDVCLEMIEPLPIHREWETKCRVQLATCDVDLEGFCEADMLGDGDSGLVMVFAPTVVAEMLVCLDSADCTARLGCLMGVFEKYHVDL